MSDVTAAPPASGAPAGAAAGVEPNYQYWREHGGAWVYEYTKRKKFEILYHIEELMLTDYVRGTARGRSETLRVLEFGCGVGRHLRNMNGLNGVEIHGYDQSETMASGCLSWATPEWFQQRVRVGMPTGPLPYEDGAFDLVYSAEVLVHVRPEHLGTVLSEILRVCRGHVLHLEPSPHIAVASEAHHGCWNHNLIEAYAKLGRACEALTRGYDAHTPFRVRGAEPAPYTWADSILEMFRRMETDIDEGFRVMRADAARAWNEREHFAASAAASQESLASARAETASTARERDVVIADRDVLLQQLASISAALDAEKAKAAEIASRLEQAMSSEARTRSMLTGEAAAWRTRAEGLAAELAKAKRVGADLGDAVSRFLSLSSRTPNR